jgi:threonine dehydrogenase-like Zn-dependent dehydrogenase
MGGGYAELTVYPKRNLIPVPDAVDDLAAALAEPLGVALRAVELSQAQAGDLAYVAGLGPVGLLTVSALSAVGCRVVGADPNAERRTLGLELGCVDAFDPSVRDPADALASHDPLGPAHTFECSGASASLEQVFDVCAPLGSVGILGIPMAPILLLRMTIKEQRAFSISGPSWESMQGALRHLQQRSEAAKIVTGTVRLEGVGDAMAGLAEGRGGVKTLVDPQA